MDKIIARVASPVGNPRRSAHDFILLRSSAVTRKLSHLSRFCSIKKSSVRRWRLAEDLLVHSVILYHLAYFTPLA
jgi:hypothetical protein